MSIGPFQICDFDYNGYCDEKDVEEFKKALGKCSRDEGYNPIFDMDLNLCIDEEDIKFLFIDSVVDAKHWMVEEKHKRWQE